MGVDIVRERQWEIRRREIKRRRDMVVVGVAKASGRGRTATGG
jgi:hypothetical protein